MLLIVNFLELLLNNLLALKTVNLTAVKTVLINISTLNTKIKISL